MDEIGWTKVETEEERILESKFKNTKRPNKPCDETQQIKHNAHQKKLIDNLIKKIKEMKEIRPACSNPNADQPEMMQNMGLGKLSGKDIVFVRTFRWTINAPEYPNITEWVQKISVNYVAKTMEIEVFDEIDGYVFQWITDMMEANKSVDFTLNHYDGIGKKLFYNCFENVKVKDHCVDYNYKSSEVVTHKLKLSYKKMRRSSNLKIN